METIDTALIQRSFGRALKTYDANAHAQHQINRRLASLLPEYAGTHYSRLLEIGCGSGDFTRALQHQCSADEWVLNDLCEECHEIVRPLFTNEQPLFQAGDAAAIAFPGTFNLIASASAFQWIDDLPHFFGKLAALLPTEGLLLFSTFAPDNLLEIKTLTGRGLTYPSMQQLREWLSSYFQILYAADETIPLNFAHPLDVLRHLKHTGVTATTSGRWTRSMQQNFCLRYRELFASDDKEQVTLTYRPLYMLAVKK